MKRRIALKKINRAMNYFDNMDQKINHLISSNKKLGLGFSGTATLYRQIVHHANKLEPLLTNENYSFKDLKFSLKTADFDDIVKKNDHFIAKDIDDGDSRPLAYADLLEIDSSVEDILAENHNHWEKTYNPDPLGINADVKYDEKMIKDEVKHGDYSDLHRDEDGNLYTRA